MACLSFLVLACVCVLMTSGASEATIWNYESVGGIPNNSSLSVCWANTALLNSTLAQLQAGDTLLIPPNQVFWFVHYTADGEESSHWDYLTG